MKLVKIAAIAALALGVQASLAAAKTGETKNCLATQQGSMDKTKYAKTAEATSILRREGSPRDNNQNPAKGHRDGKGS
jgi:hypothetical protein